MKNKDCFYVVGVMSGTSLDGLDLALIKFNLANKKWKYRFISSFTIEYSDSWKLKLSNARFKNPKDLYNLDLDYTNFLAEQIKIFINRNFEYQIDLISSHGHTVFHQPQKGITYQIGNHKMLSDLLDYTVVCDFRVQDVELGGQGAPLVPGGDFHLFSDYKACVNLGGFANISLLDNYSPIAFDISAANLILNNYAQKLNLPFDAEGKIASTGKIIIPLLDELNSLEYYFQKPPKSLGIEWLSEKVNPILSSFSEESIPNLMHTWVHHLANQILWVLPNSGKVLFTGGGTHNSFLIGLIKQKSTAQICLPSNTLINFKEALVFGFLGLLKFLGEDNCFSTVTGSSHDHSTGVIFKNIKL